MNRKGFTLIEILVTVTILGILMGLGITGVTKVINRARQEKSISEIKTLKNTTKSYIQANTDEAPKKIGDYRKITLNELKSSNFLLNDILDEKGNSCMSESYVRVYKYSNKEYTYTPFIYCGNEKAPKEEKIPSPKITITFSKYNGVSNPYFEYKIVGNEDDNEINIQGYELNVLVAKPGEYNFQEVYSSGTIDAYRKQEVSGKKFLSEYIDITGNNDVQINIIAYNDIGGKTEETATLVFGDDKGPICLKANNEAKDATEWINKKSSTKEKTIEEICGDSTGSGCIRKSFSKTWPNDDKDNLNNKIYKFGAEYAYITIKDNANNKKKCRVRVNVDLLSPTLKIKAKGNGNILKTYDVGGYDSKYKEKDTTITIESSSYEIEKGLDDNMWFNSSYEDGVSYEVELKDNLHLDHWTWKVNTPGITYKEYQDDPTIITKDLTTTSSYDGASGSFTEPDYDKEDTGLTSTKITVNLKQEGIRYGVLKVYDKAGNVTTAKIYANIDRTIPSTPTVHLLKWNDNSDTPKSSSELNVSYTAGSWSKMKVYTYPSGSTDKLGSVYYKYTTTGATTNNVNKIATYRNIKVSGESNIKWKACDSANNCTSEISNNVNVDLEKPTVTSLKVTSKNSNYNTRLVNVKIKGKDTGGSNVYKSCVQTSTDVSKCDWKTFTGELTYNDIIGAANYDGSTVNMYGWIKDVAGNISTRFDNKSYKVYKSCSETVDNGAGSCGTYGACSVECGGGVKYATKTQPKKDKYLSGVTCPSQSITNGCSQPCNQQECSSCAKKSIAIIIDKSSSVGESQANEFVREAKQIAEEAGVIASNIVTYSSSKGKNTYTEGLCKYDADYYFYFGDFEWGHGGTTDKAAHECSEGKILYCRGAGSNFDSGHMNEICTYQIEDFNANSCRE